MGWGEIAAWACILTAWTGAAYMQGRVHELEHTNKVLKRLLDTIEKEG